MTVKYIHLAETASTNAYAHSYLSKCNPNEITVIYTYNQQQGKGQIGRQWFSDQEKNFSFSLIYYPKRLIVSNSFQLVRDSSLAICEAIKQVFNVSCMIKWPNDIYYMNHKLGGILIQNTISGKEVKNAIIGVGININTTDFPEDIPNPISIKQITAKTYDLDQSFKSFGIALVDAFLNQAFDQTDYHKKLFRLNKMQSFLTADGEPFEAIIRGVDQQGLLITEGPDQSIKKFNFHELRFII